MSNDIKEMNLSEILFNRDYITTPPTMQEQCNEILSENAELENKVNDLEKEIKKYKEVLDKIKEYIEHENFKRNVLLGLSEKKYTRDILNHILELMEEIE